MNKRKRNALSMKRCRHTRGAYDEAIVLLDQVERDPAYAVLRDNPRLAQLREDAEQLGAAPKLRITASRRLQGAALRRQTASALLFDACAEVRRRIKARYRGARHAALREAFGEGLAAGPAKTQTVLALSRRILTAAVEHRDFVLGAMRGQHVSTQMLERIDKLRRELDSIPPQRTEFRRARRQVREDLAVLADRVKETCLALRALVAADAGRR